MQYIGMLNEDTGISLYHSGPVFYAHISCLSNQTHSKIDCALFSLPGCSFLGISLLEPVLLQTPIFQHGRLRLRFQFCDKHKGEKSDL